MKTITFLCLLAACGGSDNPGVDASPLPVPDDYTFSSRFVDGESSVSYSGQTSRHIIIAELKGYLSQGLLADLASLNVTANGTEVLDKLNNDYYWLGALDGEDCQPGDTCSDDGGADGNRMIQYALANGKQTLFADIGGMTSTKGGKLKEKIAGFDDVGRNWHDGGLFGGWSLGGPTNADQLVQFYFGLFQDRAETIVANQEVKFDADSNFDLNDPNGDNNTDDALIYITPQGHDLVQLTEKFLLGAIAFHQATDDYMDDAQEGKGLLSSNAQSGSSPYSSLEHVWDEGFGYYGAARQASLYRISAVAGKCGDDPGCGDSGPDSAQFDADEDGKIDAKSETHFGASVNAAKRDWGSKDNSNPATMYADAWLAFRTGRAIIAAAGDELTTDELNLLREQRNIAVRNFEMAIAATAIHYINDTVKKDMSNWNPGDPVSNFSVDQFKNLAKHWSEMKGFALTLQFSPHSPLSSADFKKVNELMGDAPLLPSGSVTAQQWQDYKDDLNEARGILQTAYGFDAENVDNW